MIENSLLDKSTYGFHSTVKAPFYLSHLYPEELLLEKFQNIDKIMQKLSIISSFLSNLEIENFNSSHKTSINVFENSLFSNSIYEDK